jgi:hypothetical protein
MALAPCIVLLRTEKRIRLEKARAAAPSDAEILAAEVEAEAAVI